MYATMLLALAAVGQQPPPQDMLAERVAALEGRVTALESRLSTFQPSRSPAAPAPSAPQAAQQQRYTVDAAGVYWPAGTMPAAGYGVPAAYYGGGFGDAGGACAGGSCGGPAGVFGLGQPVRGWLRSRR
jgi:hypothetical protein